MTTTADTTVNPTTRPTMTYTCRKQEEQVVSECVCVTVRSFNKQVC